MPNPIPNVLNSFNAVKSGTSDKPGGIEFALTNPFNADIPHQASNKHQQGMQKTQGAGYIVTGSGDRAYFYVTNANHQILAKVVTPTVTDSKRDFYDHAGGCQLVDNILVFGCEQYDDKGKGPSAVVFYDCSQIDAPQWLGGLTVQRAARDNGNSAGAVALTQTGDGTWLLVVGNWNSDRLDFYECATNLTDPGATFKFTQSWPPAGVTHKVALSQSSSTVDDVWGEYQNLNLFRQAGDNSLWLIGMWSGSADSGGLTLPLDEPDWADLYRVDYSSGNPPVLSKRSNMHFYRKGSGPRFDYASGYFYDFGTNSFEVFDCEAQLSSNNTRNRCNRWIA
jgi:hypothetical protein